MASLDFIKPYFPQKQILKRSYFQKKLVKAQTIFRWFAMPYDPEKAAEILNTCLDNYDVMAEPDFDWKRHPQKPDPLNNRSYFNQFKFYNMYFGQIFADDWVKQL